MIYPYIHLSGETTISKANILPAYSKENSNERVEQGFFIELGTINKRGYA